jgi:hypothetical protein
MIDSYRGDNNSDAGGAQRGHPVRRYPVVAFEPAELPLLDARAAVGFLNQRADRDLRLMNIETNDAFVHRDQLYTTSCRFRLEGRRWQVPALKTSEGDRSPTAFLACVL